MKIEDLEIRGPDGIWRPLNPEEISSMSPGFLINVVGVLHDSFTKGTSSAKASYDGQSKSILKKSNEKI